MLRVVECFAGIGACSKALTNLGIEHEIVDAVEIDKYAIKSFNAVHGTNFEPQDIKLWDKQFEDIDLIMYGSPCQDFSVAGKQAGGDVNSGTRSSLMYETLRIVGRIRPRYVIWENVKNLISKKHKHNYDAYISAMDALGYHSYGKVLNAKDYGIPQNRERIFTISIRNDIEKEFEFPEPFELEKQLKDLLDANVDEKYYLSEKQTGGLMMNNPEVAYCIDANYSKGTNLKQYLEKRRRQVVRVGGLYDKGETRHQAGSVYDPAGIAATLSTMQGGNQEPIIIQQKKISNTIRTGGRGSLDRHSWDIVTEENPIRIRKLTPKECWRLMGFDDASFERAEKVNSNSQLYKQAGNSICVAVLEAIFKQLL